MKKNLFILSAIAVTAAALVSCEKEQDVNVKEEPQGVPFEIVAGPIETKTVNDGMSTNWVAGDEINLFHAINGEATYVNDGAFSAAAGGASVSFTGTLAAPLASENYDWFAVYPYNAGFDTPAGTAKITIPAAQTQVGNSSKAHLAGANCPVAGNGKNIAHNVTPTVTFKHLTSIIKVHVTNKTASAVTVEGVSITAPVNINGAYNLTLTGDSPALSGDGGSATTSLTVSGASALAVDGSADFYMAVKPFDVTAGQEISLCVSTNAGDQTLTTIMPSSYTFAVGKIATLNFNYTNKAITLARFKYNDGGWLNDNSIKPAAANSAVTLTGNPQTIDEITVSSTDGSTATRVYANKDEAYDLRVYSSGGSFSVSSTDGYFISKIAVTESGLAGSSTFGVDAANVEASCGTKSGNTKIVSWTGSSQNVLFTAKSSLQIGTITVFYQAATASDHVVSLPVIKKGVAYSAGSTTFSIRTLNVSDLVFSSTSPGFTSTSYSANTLTVNYAENTGSDPRDIVVNVTSASAGFAGTLTISQDGAPTKINTLTSPVTGVTVTGQVTACTTKGFVLTDGTASIYVYLNATPSAYSIGQTVTVAGNVVAYNKGLQFAEGATITEVSTGSYVYPSPTTYGLAEVTAFNADASNRLPTYVQFNAVVDHSSSYYNFYVGGTTAINATLYNAPSSFTSGLATGDYVTVKGYAAIISAGKMGIYVTEITESDSAPVILYSDLLNVNAAGVNNATHTLTPYRTSETTATIQSKPDWVTSATVNAPTCTTLTYTVSTNGATPRSGEIVVRLTKSAVNYDYTIKISQPANASNFSWDLTTTSYKSDVSDDLITWEHSKATMTNAKNGGTKVTNWYPGGGKSETRMYNKNILTIAPASGVTIVSVEFTCSTPSYATTLSGLTWTNGTATKSGSVVTVTPTTGTSNIVLNNTSTFGLTNVKVYYTE